MSAGNSGQLAAFLRPPQAEDDGQPRLQRLVDAVSPNAASVYDARLDYRRGENQVRMSTWDRAARAC